jgi:hypothetical protein
MTGLPVWSRSKALDPENESIDYQSQYSLSSPLLTMEKPISTLELPRKMH